MYLEAFRLPDNDTEETIMMRKAGENGGALPYLENTYPCRLFPQKGLKCLSFAPLTILYGGNGSGKSTLLNIIAEKLGLARTSPFNRGEMYPLYLEQCAYDLGDDELPSDSRIITSDDIFDYMLAAREINNEIDGKRENAREEYASLRYGESIRFTGLDDYEKLHAQNQARRSVMTRHKYEVQRNGKLASLGSNGETALAFFQKKLQDDTLYLLDEPENSMSPKMQQELAELILQSVRYLGDQFVIATHSPFLLAMEGARIYNLDADPVQVCDWWTLPNMQLYYEFFKNNENLFQK